MKKIAVFGEYAPGGMRQNPPRTSGTSKVSVRPILQRGMRQGFRAAELRYAPRVVPCRPNVSIDNKSCTRVCARVCAGAFTWSCRGVPGCAPGCAPGLAPGRLNVHVDSRLCIKVCAMVCAGACNWSYQFRNSSNRVCNGACTRSAQCTYR